MVLDLDHCCDPASSSCRCHRCCTSSFLNDHTYSLLKRICHKIIKSHSRQQCRENYSVFEGGNSTNLRTPIDQRGSLKDLGWQKRRSEEYNKRGQISNDRRREETDEGKLNPRIDLGPLKKSLKDKGSNDEEIRASKRLKKGSNGKNQLSAEGKSEDRNKNSAKPSQDADTSVISKKSRKEKGRGGKGDDKENGEHNKDSKDKRKIESTKSQSNKSHVEKDSGDIDKKDTDVTASRKSRKNKRRGDKDDDKESGNTDREESKKSRKGKNEKEIDGDRNKEAGKNVSRKSDKDNRRGNKDNDDNGNSKKDKTESGKSIKDKNRSGKELEREKGENDQNESKNPIKGSGKSKKRKSLIDDDDNNRSQSNSKKDQVDGSGKSMKDKNRSGKELELEKGANDRNESKNPIKGSGNSKKRKSHIDYDDNNQSQSKKDQGGRFSKSKKGTTGEIGDKSIDDNAINGRVDIGGSRKKYGDNARKLNTISVEDKSKSHGLHESGAGRKSFNKKKGVSNDSNINKKNKLRSSGQSASKLKVESKSGVRYGIKGSKNIKVDRPTSRSELYRQRFLRPSRCDEVRPCDILRTHLEQRDLSRGFHSCPRTNNCRMCTPCCLNGVTGTSC
ncbi:myb-like protein X isoform X2 [Drosophila miranda]|uniref:myb-like protein X isoform X2 n=1 Tax=Drosophila miranda TaxID=7229 RepID=UPI0007E6B34C|nr:myb-like protein X isoform X2 [Drosophila miranda]